MVEASRRSPGGKRSLSAAPLTAPSRLLTWTMPSRLKFDPLSIISLIMSKIQNFLEKNYPRTYTVLQVLDTLSLYGLLLGCLAVLSSSPFSITHCAFNPSFLLHLYLVSNGLSVVEKHFLFTVRPSSKHLNLALIFGLNRWFYRGIWIYTNYVIFFTLSQCKLKDS